MLALQRQANQPPPVGIYTSFSVVIIIKINALYENNNVTVSVFTVWIMALYKFIFNLCNFPTGNDGLQD